MLLPDVPVLDQHWLTYVAFLVLAAGCPVVLRATGMGTGCRRWGRTSRPPTWRGSP